MPDKRDYLDIRVTLRELDPEEVAEREQRHFGGQEVIKESYDCKVMVRSSALSGSQLKACAMALQETIIKLATEDRTGAFMQGLMSVTKDKLNIKED